MYNFLFTLAQATTPAAAPGPNPLLQMVPILLLFVVFYLFLIRPQQKQKKELAKLLSEIKSGDKVVTSGGIHGVVANIKDKQFTLRIAEGKMEVDKASVVRVTEKGSGSES